MIRSTDADGGSSTSSSNDDNKDASTSSSNDDNKDASTSSSNDDNKDASTSSSNDNNKDASTSSSNDNDEMTIMDLTMTNLQKGTKTQIPRMIKNLSCHSRNLLCQMRYQFPITA